MMRQPIATVISRMGLIAMVMIVLLPTLKIWAKAVIEEGTAVGAELISNGSSQNLWFMKTSEQLVYLLVKDEVSTKVHRRSTPRKVTNVIILTQIPPCHRKERLLRSDLSGADDERSVRGVLIVGLENES